MRPAEAPGPTGYDAVVVGGPMIMGWHRAAARYVKQHRDALADIPFALFITAASLTEDGASEVGGVPVAKDPWLVKAPRNADKLRRKERYALPRHYLGDIQKACAPARPRSVAFFAGSLDLTTMNLFEKVFVLLVIGATPGDGRHWEFVREWAAGLGEALAPLRDGPATRRGTSRRRARSGAAAFAHEARAGRAPPPLKPRPSPTRPARSCRCGRR